MSPTSTFVASSSIPAPAADVFAVYERPGAFERLTPPYEHTWVVRRQGSIRDGDRAELRMKIGPFSRRWLAEHRDYEEGHQFVDVQVQGPFARWEHRHRVEPSGPESSLMIDQVAYRLPLGRLGDVLGRRLVERWLRRMFGYRHAVLAHDAKLHRRAEGRLRRVAVTGASGLLGRSLTALLESGGHTVVPLVRDARRDGIRWSPQRGEIDRSALEGFDAIVNLAGENIAQRWTPKSKARIRDSRWEGTRLLAETITSLVRPPEVFVSVSGVHFYGDTGSVEVDEQSPPGEGFLAEVCRGWEQASRIADTADTRVVNPRMGVVLSPAGGALSKMKLPFSLGLGVRVGDGQQPMSWVGIDDAVGVLYWAILDDRMSGPVNVVAPESVDNAAFTRTLGRVLRRPTPFVIPRTAVKLALGEMGEATLIEGQRVRPVKLEEAGYPFAHTRLEDALRHVLGKPE